MGFKTKKFKAILSNIFTLATYKHCCIWSTWFLATTSEIQFLARRGRYAHMLSFETGCLMLTNLFSNLFCISLRQQRGKVRELVGGWVLVLAGEYKRVFFHVQTKRARFYLTLLGLEWLGGFQVFHGGALLKASCVFTDIFATLLAEMKWAWPTTSCSAAQTHTCRQPRPEPHPYHPFPKAQSPLFTT